MYIPANLRVAWNELRADDNICISQATPAMGLWKIAPPSKCGVEPEGRYGDYSLGLFRSGNTVLGPPNDGEIPRHAFSVYSFIYNKYYISKY